MIRQPRVSVIMVTADHHAPYIREAVDSVLGQTFKEWELIIVDDGPAGAGAERLAGYTDPRIYYVRQDHIGVEQLGVTYNRARALAKAPLVAILEGDDYWPPDKLGIQIPDIEQSEAILSYGIVTAVSADGRAESWQSPSLDVQKEQGALENSPIGRTAIAMARHWQFVSPASIVIRRNVLDRIGGFQQPDYYSAVDFPTVLKLATMGKFRYHPSVLGFGRQHRMSVTASVVSGKAYTLGMFRCWLETMRASDVQLSKRDIDTILAHWRGRFSGHYRVLGRQALHQGDGKQARACFLTSLDGSSGVESVPAVGGVIVSYIPKGSRVLEACYKLTGRKSVDKAILNESVKEATDMISALEAWAAALESLCSGDGNQVCLA